MASGWGACASRGSSSAAQRPEPPVPELPEVETTRRQLVEGGLLERTIERVQVQWTPTVGGDAALFSDLIAGRRFVAARRRAKYLLLDLDGGITALCHLRMSGRLACLPADRPESGYERLTLTLAGGLELRFHDPRKFGRFLLEEDADQRLADLAPEPLGDQFTVRHAARYLRGRSRMLKPLLLDQRALVAGLGNIYVDEALWLARLHPCAPASSLTRREAEALHNAVRTVIQRGINNLGTSLGRGKTNFKLPSGDSGANQEQLAVFRRTGANCPRGDEGVVQRLVVGQRSTHICPVCQRRPRARKR